MQIVLASTNPGKIREFGQILAPMNWDVRGLSDFGEIPAVEETGRTFRDNAVLKATYYARGLGSWTLADDSGLAVDHLGGKPGVHSARWAKLHDAGEGDEANNRLLLKQMAEAPDEKRAARFICVLALSDPTGRIMLTTMDWMEGRLLHAPRGGGGFGYDPLFFVESLGKTTAELEPEAKNAISHRGKAMRRMGELMKSILPPASLEALRSRGDR
jgi:XTP/dITP diphosphohydrolase